MTGRHPGRPARAPLVPLAALLLTLASPGIPAADLLSAKIPDDSTLRAALRDTWFVDSPAQVLARQPEYHRLPNGDRVRVSAGAGGAGSNEFVVVLARETTGGGYPGWAQGSWALTRNRSDGAPTRIRVFPRSDPYTYLQFRPFTGDKVVMDVVAYDGYLVRSVPLPFAFDRLYTLPLEDVLAEAGPTKFPRRYFDPDPDRYRDLRAVVAAVRGRLPGLTYRDDGAIDEAGRYVFIDSLRPQDGRGGLNCSGFAKWFVDGLLRPITGGLLAVAPLKTPFGDRGDSLTAPWEASRDPFFGLDWCRNLAARAGEALRSPAFASLDEIEVRARPCAQVILRNAGAGGAAAAEIRSYPGFLTNAGYGIEGLHALLYALAIDEPGRVYLAAVSAEQGAPVTDTNPRGAPRLRQYFHVAVLIPYFTERGAFQVAVFESAAETSFSAFKARYPGHFVNLSRIPVSGGAFAPD